MAKSGKDGGVYVGDGTDELIDINEWNEDEDPNLEETPTFGDEVVTHTATLPAFSGSFSGYFDPTDKDKIEGGMTIPTLKLEIDDGNYVEGEAIMGTISTSINVEGVGEIDADFNFQEKPTWTTT